MADNSRQYSQKTIKMIFALSKNHCAFPGCGTNVVVIPPSGEGIIIGEIAHIYAANGNGPRAKPLLSEQEKNGFDNLLVLCPTHHTLVDKAPNDFPAELLLAWKAGQLRNAESSGLAPKPHHPEVATNEKRAPFYVLQSGFSIPKPKDWQAFQRACVVLFRNEIRDPNLQEYGRNGQNQSGIDLIGKREQDGTRRVGIQCRLISRPLPKEIILKDCKAALSLGIDFKELIFATSAPDDVKSANAAVEVEEILRAEGASVSVSVYGWSSIENLISLHPQAFDAFYPQHLARFDQVFDTSSNDQQSAFADLIAEKVSARIQAAQTTAKGVDQPIVEDLATEDPALHGKIDQLRDLFRDDRQFTLAERKLRGLLNTVDLPRRPWAHFRILTNLAAVSLDLGRQEEGADLFEQAYSLRPEDPKAMSNLGLARIIQGKYDEGMRLASAALATGKVDDAVGYLLQAAARCGWIGNPETLIPDRLKDTIGADIGIVEFLRRREEPGWEKKVVEIAGRYPDRDEFQRARATAVLAIAIERDGRLNQLPDWAAEIFEDATNDLVKLTSEYLSNGFADKHDLAAYANNAAVMLRFLSRHDDAEVLLKKAVEALPDDEVLIRFLALTLVTQDKFEQARKVLANTRDPESRLFLADVTDEISPSDAYDIALNTVIASNDLRSAVHRGQILGECALKMIDTKKLQVAISELKVVSGGEISASLLRLQASRLSGGRQVDIKQDLKKLCASLETGAPLSDRYALAKQCMASKLPQETADLLAGYVDLSRPTAVVRLYLQALTATRQDVKFFKIINAASDALKSDSAILWHYAAHAWNVGDLPSAQKAVVAYLDQVPNDAAATILKLDIVLRRNDLPALKLELEKPIEELGFARLGEKLRVAELLERFDFPDRAAKFFYRIYLDNRDNARAWLGFLNYVLEIARPRDDGRWDADVVCEDVAVDIEYEDGQPQFFVVEPDATLRRIDTEAWEPSHPVAKLLRGLKVDDNFELPNGRKGKITKIRHKFVARLQYIMEHYETRFPQMNGLMKISIDLEKEGGLDQLLQQVKTQHDWGQELTKRYSVEGWPLALLASHARVDVIDAALGMAAANQRIIVAEGSEAERTRASRSIYQNRKTGVVLDLLAWWLVWRLAAVDIIEDVCGKITVPQTLLDALRLRREKLIKGAAEGHKSASYAEGKIQLSEIEPETIADWLKDTDAQIAWIEQHAEVSAVTIGNRFTDVLRELVKNDRRNMFDSFALAVGRDQLLLSDDLKTRQFTYGLGQDTKCAALQNVFNYAYRHGRISQERYTQMLTGLIDFGQDYVGINASDIRCALKLDGMEPTSSGRHFKLLLGQLGGKRADPLSHVFAATEAITGVWRDADHVAQKMRATGAILEAVTRDRPTDYAKILASIASHFRGTSIFQYMLDWAQGHFMLDFLNEPVGIYQNYSKRSS